MRISVKGRYALAATIKVAETHMSGDHITVGSISETLGISKIYLEQVFSLLRRGDVVSSVKGAQGGYRLVRSPSQTTVLQILASVETALFETVENTVSGQAPEIDSAMRITVFNRLDQAVVQALSSITLDDLLSEVANQQADQTSMYYI